MAAGLFQDSVITWGELLTRSSECSSISILRNACPI